MHRWLQRISRSERLMIRLLTRWLIDVVVDWCGSWLSRWLINVVVDWCGVWLMRWLIDAVVDWCGGWLMRWLIDAVVDWCGGWLMRWLFDATVGWWSGCLMRWLPDAVVDWCGCWLMRLVVQCDGWRGGWWIRLLIDAVVQWLIDEVFDWFCCLPIGLLTDELVDGWGRWRMKLLMNKVVWIVANYDYHCMPYDSSELDIFSQNINLSLRVSFSINYIKFQSEKKLKLAE